MLLKFLDRVFKLFISVKLAVVVLIILGIFSAVGTIYEAQHGNAEYSQKMIYHSPGMYFFLGLMCIQLICVMIDRWPWKKRHIPFLLAHVGIIMTLAGSLVTRYWGIDGSMTLGIGDKSRRVTTGEKEIVVLSSFDGQKYSQMAAQNVDFLLRPPSEYPVSIPLGPDVIKVQDYYHYALEKEEIESSANERDGSALRFQLENERVNLSRWLLLQRGQSKDEVNLGPARVILTENENLSNLGDGNLIIVQFHPLTKKATYEIRSHREGKKVLRGELTEGLNIETGWMGLKLRVLRWIPHAERKVTYVPKESWTEMTTSAIKINFQDKDYWVGLNRPLRLFTETSVFIFSFGNRRLDLGFDMTLNDFRIGHYQGTSRAMSYESEVSVEGMGKTTISMNEPLKYQGFTFYQASFQEDDMGKPVASVLSVNQDPGRLWKYLGSFLTILGAILLFYRRGAQRVQTRVTRPAAEK